MMSIPSGRQLLAERDDELQVTHSLSRQFCFDSAPSIIYLSDQLFLAIGYYGMKPDV
jgi:hypothetical protein